MASERACGHKTNVPNLTVIERSSQSNPDIYIMYIYIYGEEGVLRKVEKIQVIGNRPPGRPKGILDQLVQRDMKKKGLKEEQTMDRKS